MKDGQFIKSKSAEIEIEKKLQFNILIMVKELS